MGFSIQASGTPERETIRKPIYLSRHEEREVEGKEQDKVMPQR